MNAAQKANRTRANRVRFQTTYPDTHAIAEDIMRGYTTQSIADYHDTTVTRVAAVAANLNRQGNFRDMARRCNW